jgi:DNA-binding MarR family transcriptional regulator
MPESHPETAILAERLRPVLLRLSRQLRRQSAPVGLSAIDAMLLGLILKRQGVGVSELADHEQMARPTMSAHVKRLEAAGWIVRDAPAAQDKRRIGLRITPEGQAALLAVRQRRNDWLARELEALDGAERAAVEAAIAPLARIAGEPV